MAATSAWALTSVATAARDAFGIPEHVAEPPYTFVWRGSLASAVHYPAVAVVVYLMTIFGLQRVMRDRPALRLTPVAFLHNVFLCALSAAMCAGSLWELRSIYASGGVAALMCDRDRSAVRGRLGFWMYIFYLSKYYELLDTVLMVVKKRRLNFLHVYHHCIVIPLFYVYMTTDMVSQWILVVANSFVHVLMYYYYAAATIGRTVWWKKYITQAQIVQFIIDLTATWPYPFLYFSSAGCSGSMRGWLFGQAVGLSFFKLFRDFYVRSYTKSAAASRAKLSNLAASTTTPPASYDDASKPGVAPAKLDHSTSDAHATAKDSEKKLD